MSSQITRRIMEPKKVKESLTVMCEFVLPDDANTLGNLRGGKLIDWMDIAGEITAQRHSGMEAVTASIAQVTFRKAIRVGDIVTIKARMTRTFRTSMEIKVEVWAENRARPRRVRTNEAIFTYVAVDAGGKTTPVPGIIPVGEKEKLLYEEAGKRRKNNGTHP